jgi:hypothetical protein
MIRTMHYVPYHSVLDWLRLGWIVVKPNCAMHHDHYSCVMEWLCDCEMVRPA